MDDGSYVPPERGSAMPGMTAEGRDEEAIELVADVVVEAGSPTADVEDKDDEDDEHDCRGDIGQDGVRVGARR